MPKSLQTLGNTTTLEEKTDPLFHSWKDSTQSENWIPYKGPTPSTNKELAAVNVKIETRLQQLKENEYAKGGACSQARWKSPFMKQCTIGRFGSNPRTYRVEHKLP